MHNGGWLVYVAAGLLGVSAATHLIDDMPRVFPVLVRVHPIQMTPDAAARS